MKDAGVIKCASILSSAAIVITMLVTDGVEANVAAAGLLAALSGIGGYAVATSRKAPNA